jgi:cellulose synthase/poly-beta-1,6-N-acetylglucosamine synthase-like glycosyltransferase
MSLSDPSVSVLMPVRDESELLASAMESMLAQTLDDFEIVLVDDGSSNETRDASVAWGERDTRVTVLRQAPLGIVAALEHGRSIARGRYLARMDADDIAHPDRLAIQFDLMELSPGLAGCGCGVEYFPREVVRDGARRYEAWLNALVSPEQIAASIFVECPLAHPTFFLRSSVVEGVGGYVDRGWPEDYDLVLRLWEAGHRLGKVPSALHSWRERPERLSRTDGRYAPSAFLRCKVHYLRETLLARGRPVVIWGAGPVGKTMARALQTEGTSVEAFVELDPRKIGQEIHGAPVLSPDETLSRYGDSGAEGMPLHLAAVGQAGARERILEQLRGAGLSVLQDFVAVA